MSIWLGLMLRTDLIPSETRLQVPTTSSRDIDWRSNPAAFFDSISPNLPRPTSFPTADEVRQESRRRASKILSDWETLNKIIERHEERIQKRWRQKTKTKRRQVLLSAWPNMSKMHRPDFDAFKKGRHEESREAYLWPYINLEDLEQTRPLLLLLNARSRHQPHCFAHADYNAPHLGHGTVAIRSAFLNLHTMMFTGRTTPETYGELIAWDDNDDAYLWFHHGKGFHPGHGLVLLETQQRIYEFLLDCTRQILHDISEEALIKDFPVLPEPAIKDEGDWHSLAAVAADAPYRLPAQLDLASLEDIIDAKRSAAENHLIALREDPGYFADVVNEHKEHRLEVIPNTNGNAHPTLAPHIHPLFWNRVLQNLVPEAYVNVEMWSTVHSLVDSIVPVTRGMTRRNAVYDVLTRISGNLQRTPPWVEPERPPAEVKHLEKSLADLQFELVHRTEKTIESVTAPLPKKKVKSQGKPSVSDKVLEAEVREKAVEPEVPAEIERDIQPTFKVDKRALKVFSTLFFQPSQTGQPGEIPGNDFLHAIGTAAFTVEKLYGSVWQFTPRNLDVERSIQFHEPHPIAKIPFGVARRIGRRLNRAYGWHGQIFTLA